MESIVELAKLYEKRIKGLEEEIEKLEDRNNQLFIDLGSVENDFNDIQNSFSEIDNLFNDGFFCKKCEYKDVRGSGYCDGCELLVEIRNIIGYI